MVDAKKGVTEMETKWQLAMELREAAEKKKWAQLWNWVTCRVTWRVYGVHCEGG